jgi:hypothetical protein
MLLKINGFDKIAAYFYTSKLEFVEVKEADDSYRIKCRRNGHPVTVGILRTATRRCGDWYYVISAYPHSIGYVTAEFLKRPENLVLQLESMLKR